MMMLLLALWAGELRTPVEEALVELAAAQREGDQVGAARLLAELGELYPFAASDEERHALVAALGEGAKSRDRAAATAAVRGLGATGSDEAVAHVEPFLRSLAVVAEELPLRIEAVRAAGALHAPALLMPLLHLARKCEETTLAEQAFFALGDYCRAPAQLRAQAVARVLEAGTALERPSGREAARARRLRAPMLRALQRLVGRPLNTVEQFADWWAAVKEKKDPFEPS
ncbi:MAG: hypothetical protein ACT4PV_07280 [Planctomycetaceae bacterium]